MVIDSNILTLQNPWWSDPTAIEADQHIQSIEGKSYRFTPAMLDTIELEGGDIHILRGPRQVGKTTTLKLFIKKLLEKGTNSNSIIYISCESIESFSELQQIIIQCLQDRKRNFTYLFLDEISFVESWQRAILSLSNMGMLLNVSTFLTGSNARDLKESAERLPGRRGKGRDHKLYPLSIADLKKLECFKNKSLEEILNIYMAVGGFPRAIKDHVTEGYVTDTTYETYRNWITSDAARYDLRQETLKQILFRISETQASRITWPKLIENSPVRSHETALQYVEHLQDAFLCNILYCYDTNKKGRAEQKARKIYFIDPLLFALANTWKDSLPNIANFMLQKLKDDGFRGKMFESIAINHIMRMHDPVYYWYSTKHHKEVDILIPLHENNLLYDVKLKHSETFRSLGKKVVILCPDDFLKLIMQHSEISEVK